MSHESTGSADRESQLDEAVAEYLREVEAGRVPDRGAFLSRYPALANELAEFLDDRERVQRLIGPIVSASDATLTACPQCKGVLETAVPGATRCGCGWRFQAGGSADPFPVPHWLGRIQLTEVIGRGAFGTVYRGRDTAMRRDVAVKALRKDPNATPERLERFRRDPQIVAQLEHHGIVTVYDTGESADGVPYLVSQFVPGRTLAGLIRDARPQPRDAAALVAAIADALHHAHQRGVIHRDIKPANILMRTDHEPLLTDFGLALWDTDAATLTEDGRIIGTLAYMSPEQARGEAHRVDGRSDVYSLGIVLYELLTGARPFVGNVRGVLHQIEFDDPRAPRELDDRVPKDLETVCLMCLRKEPNRRYASAADLATDLRSFLNGKPVRARPVGRGERLFRWGRRNPALAAAVGLVTVLLVVASALSAAWAVHAGRQADTIQQALDRAKLVTAETELDRGLAEAERGDVAVGLLWMTRSLNTAPPNADDLTWTIRVNLNAWRGQLFALTDCTGPPPGRVLAFSPDGRSAWVVGSDAKQVRRWNLATGRFDGPVLDHPSPVAALAVGPDGQQVATGCTAPDEPVRLWNAETGAAVTQYKSPGAVQALAFLPDGRGLVAAVKTQRDAKGESLTTVRSLDATGAPVRPDFRIPGPVEALAVSSDGAFVFVVATLGKTVRGYELASGRLQDWALAHPVPVRAMAADPAGRYLLTAGDDRLARLWDIRSGRVVGTFHHRGPVSTVGFAAAGRGFLTASPDDAVRVWGAPEGEPATVATIPNRAGVRALAVSPDGRLIATGSDDRLVRLWEPTLTGLALHKVLPEQRSPIKFVGFSPNGRLVAASTFQHNGAHVWDVTTGEEHATLNHGAKVHRVAFSPDSGRAVTAAYDNDVCVWNTGQRNGGFAVPDPLRHGRHVLSAAFSPNGRTLVTGGLDGVARTWDAATGAALEPNLSHDDPVRVIAFSPNGRTVLLAGDKTARLWDADTGATAGPPLPHGFGIRAAALAPDARTVITGGWDHTARLWDGETGAALGPPLRHTDAIWVVAIAPNGRWALSASDDGTARVWGVKTARPLGPALAHTAEVKCAAIDPSGAWVVTAGLDATIRRWAAPAPREGSVRSLAAWARVVSGIDLDPSGAAVVLDATAWRLAREQLQELENQPEP